MTDRYADAVRRRRAELHAQQELLAPGHRADVRTACALTRITVASEVAATVAELAREVTDHVERGSRRDRSRLPGHVAVATAAAQADVVRRTRLVLVPALRRIATVRGIDPAAVADVGASGPPPVPVLPRPAAAPGRWQSAASAGAGWRLGLVPVVGIPAVGLPAVAGPAAIAPAAGFALLGLGWGAATRFDAADRARWRQSTAAATAAARAALDAALLATLLAAERQACAALDAAVRARRTVVVAELSALAPAGWAAGQDGVVNQEDADALG